MSVYLPWLTMQVEKNGGRFDWQEIQTWADIDGDCDLIINCSGLGSRKLAGDRQLRGIRGQSVQIECEDIHEFSDDDNDPRGLTLVYPRINDVWLGATWERFESRAPNEAATEDILQRCTDLEPKVSSGRVVGVKVGVRPSRPLVRLEVETDVAQVPVVHNYGHGGSGVKTSWACAWDVVAHCRALAK